VELLPHPRYILIAAARTLVRPILLDIIVIIIYSLLIFSPQPVNLYNLILTQSLFDHVETGLEVVAGYQVEYSGSKPLMIFLAEYLYLVIASIYSILFLVGG
jgi:hypothetical protein